MFFILLVPVAHIIPINYMNKKHLKLLIIIACILGVLGVGLSLFSLFETYQNKVVIEKVQDSIKPDILSESEKRDLNLYHLGVYDAISRDSNNKVIDYKMIGVENPEEIKLELMTDAEKTEKNLRFDSKMQVLERDENGKVAAYRLIKKDSDIITEY